MIDYKLLINKALEGREQAYVPYSHYPVGAAVIGEDGIIYTGCNIENASYGATNCAERTAIFNAVSAGNRKITALALVGSTNEFIYPCGICRQVIAEFATADLPIILIRNEQDYKLSSLAKLLPHAFGPEDLAK